MDLKIEGPADDLALIRLALEEYVYQAKMSLWNDNCQDSVWLSVEAKMRRAKAISAEMHDVQDNPRPIVVSA